MDEVQAKLDLLIADLERGLEAYAQAYLDSRSAVDPVSGKTYITVEDAKQNATKHILTTGLVLPEIARFRIMYLLGIQRAVEV